MTLERSHPPALQERTDSAHLRLKEKNSDEERTGEGGQAGPSPWSVGHGRELWPCPVLTPACPAGRRRHCPGQPRRLRKLEFMGKGKKMLGNPGDSESPVFLSETVETEKKQNTSEKTKTKT